MYLSTVWSDLKQVNWTSKKEAWKHFKTVIKTVLVASLYIGALDALFLWIFG